MADKVIGLDVGTNAVRAVAVTLGDRPRISQLGQMGLPSGAVHEGEVVDVQAVATQLRALWKQVGFNSKAVRVGIASARVILRVVDMPPLSEGDTRSALRFQLGEYVPLAPEATVFDYQPLDDEDGGGDAGRRLVLAAAPRDAVQPLIDAVKEAGLKVVAVDVLAAALARTVTPDPSSPDVDPPVEAIVSIGAGSIVVVVAREGEPLFARTVTNVSGRHVTERIAAELSVPHREAEQFKRQATPGTSDDVAARVQLATTPSIAEICEEIGDSLAYYGAQPGSPAVDSVAITGGGSLLVGLRERLERRLRLPVRLLDPFARFEAGLPGFDDEDVPVLAPYMASAVGVALGATLRKDKQINLVPEAAPLMSRSRRSLAVGGLVAVAVVGGGYLVLQQNQALTDARSARTQVEQALVPARELAAQRTLAAEPISAARTSASALLSFARATDVDWALVTTELDATSEPIGVTVTSVTGTAVVPATTPAAATPAAGAPAAGAPAATEAGAAAPAVGSSTEAAPATTVPAPSNGTGDPAASAAAGTAAAAPAGLGTVTVSGTAPDLNTVAAWIDAVMANPHFTGAWVGATTEVTDPAGTTQIEFTATVTVTAENVVRRTIPEAGQS